MVSLLKSLFSAKQLSDTEWIDAWNKSEKTWKEYLNTMCKIKTKKDEHLLSTINLIKLKTNEDIQGLLIVLEEGKYHTMAITASKSRKKLFYIYEQMKFISEVSKIIAKESVMYFAFASKFDIFSFWIKTWNGSADHKQDWRKLIVSKYFVKGTYLSLIEYYLINDNEKELKFLLPNTDNIRDIVNSQSIYSYIAWNSWWVSNNSWNEGDVLNEQWLNLIIYFQGKQGIIERDNAGTDEKYEWLTKWNKYYPNNFQTIENLLSLFGVSTIVNKKKQIPWITFLTNIVNNKIKLNYSSIQAVETFETFQHIVTDLFAVITRSKSTVKNLCHLPLEITRILWENKAKIDYLIYWIDSIYSKQLYDPRTIKNFILKFLFEHYTDSLVSTLQLYKILTFLLTYHPNLKDWTEEIKEDITFITIIDKVKIQVTFTEILQHKYRITYEKHVLKLICDYLFCICNNFKYDDFNFIDKNSLNITSLLNYLNRNWNPDNSSLNKTSSIREYTLGTVLISFINQYPNYSKYILNIISNNTSLNLNHQQRTELIQKFLPYACDIELFKTIEEYIGEYSNRNDTDEISIVIELERVLDFLSLKILFNQYRIDLKLWDEFNYNNYLDNLDELLEIYLIKTFNIDQITQISDFVTKRPSLEIQNKWKLSQGCYLYKLYLFFNKYQREELANQVIKLWFSKGEAGEDYGVEEKIKLINTIYNNVLMQNKDKFKDFVNTNGWKLFILENSNSYIDIWCAEEKDDTKEEIKFSGNAENNDLWSVYTLIKINNDFIHKDNGYDNHIKIFDEYKISVNHGWSTWLEVFENKNIENKEKVNYKYSLHPKLVDSLQAAGYWEYIQSKKINFEVKVKIYLFCLKTKISTLQNIIEYENINFDNISSGQEKYDSNFGMLMNLYIPELAQQISSYLKQKINLNDTLGEPQSEAIKILIKFNLSNLKYISFDNIIFLHNILNFPISSSNETTAFIKMLSECNTKMNILPFLHNFETEIYPSHRASIDHYYNDQTIMSNSKYFISLASSIWLKYLNLEIFKNITMNTFINYSKILKKISHLPYDRIPVPYWLALKIMYNYFSLSSVHEEQTTNGWNGWLNIIVSLNLKNEDIKRLYEDIFFLPHLSFILEGSNNILLFEGKVQDRIFYYFSSRNWLCEQLRVLYPDIFNNYVWLQNGYKIFKVKYCIILNYFNNTSKDLKEAYNSIRWSDDFSEWYNELSGGSDKVRNEIYSIYTNEI